MHKLQPQSKQINGLNSLRFFAFLSVFFYHTTTFFKNGYFGVDFFFVLSSFLLTYLALSEIDLTGTFSKKNFFIRRALRIYPLYFVVVLFSFFILPLIASQVGFTITLPHKKIYYYLFLSNYDHSDHLFALKFLWSISIEEQFYLLFLLLSLFFSGKIWIPVSAMLLAAVIYLFVSEAQQINAYYTIFNHFINFGFGMILAKLYFKNKMPSLYLSFILLLLIGAVFYFIPLPSVVFNFSLALMFCLILVCTIHIAKSELVFKNWLYRITDYLGKQTYGQYVFSGFVITIGSKLFKHQEHHLIVIILELVFTIFVAYISYTFFESKLLKLKNRFR